MILNNTSQGKERLILELHEVRIIDFGQFKIKSGLISPYYLDLRLLVTYPYLLELVSDVIWEQIRLIPFDLIVGVPYAALPIATALSLRHNKPIIMVRKEQKDHGTGRLIEGVFHSGQHVVVIDDVVSDGASKLETIKPIEDQKLVVKDIVVLVDRGQGGPAILEEKGYHCRCITTMEEILEVLHKYNRISFDQYMQSRKFMYESYQPTVASNDARQKIAGKRAAR